MTIPSSYHASMNLHTTNPNPSASIHKADGAGPSNAAQLDDSPIAAKRNSVIQDVNEIRRHFSELRTTNRSTEELESVYDDILYPTIINMMNKRKPDNQIAYLKDGLKTLPDIDVTEKNQLLIQLQEPSSHTVAADARQFGDQTSLIIFESLPNGKYMDYDLEDFQKNIPKDTKVAVFCLDQQKSSYGCKMFSLSNASKLSEISMGLEKLHHLNLSNNANAMLEATGSHEVEREGKVNIFDLPSNITPRLMKHTQARSTLKKLAGESLERTINKKGETLPERQQNHLVTRDMFDISSHYYRPQTKRFSASIEDKRLTYLDRALDYLKTAPASEINTLANEFNQLKEGMMMPYQYMSCSDSEDELTFENIRSS